MDDIVQRYAISVVDPFGHQICRMEYESFVHDIPAMNHWFTLLQGKEEVRYAFGPSDSPSFGIKISTV